MKALARIMGLYDVFHPCSLYKCIWCLVTDLLLADFTIENWEFRNVQQMREIGLKAEGYAESSKSAFARKNYGIRVTISASQKHH